MNRLGKDIHIYFPSQYPKKISPAQRYRMEQFEELLEKERIFIHCFPFFEKKMYPILFERRYIVKKALAICKGFINRFIELFSLNKYDLIFINREASPLGPPIFEWLYVKIFRKKIIYDFDDAVWLSNTSEANRITHFFKAFWKIKHIIRWTTVVICGNDYLSSFAKKYNNNIVLLPTVVDTKKRFNKTVEQDVSEVTIGWTGSFSTMPYLEKLIPVQRQKALEIPFKFILISNKKPYFELPNMEYVDWDEENEVSKLAECQVGLMPMDKDEWACGKCGLKIL